MSPMASQITSVLIVFSTIYIHGTENIKAPRYWPLWGETTGDRWFPITKDQWRGKYFQLMTSSWIKVIHYLAVPPRQQWTQRTESLVPPTRLHYPTDSLGATEITNILSLEQNDRHLQTFSLQKTVVFWQQWKSDIVNPGNSNIYTCKQQSKHRIDTFLVLSFSKSWRHSGYIHTDKRERQMCCKSKTNVE